VVGTLAVNGTVNANGYRNDWGGGSGGSVWLKAGTIRGSGSVTALYSGTGSSSTPGGGRISLVQTEAMDWTAFTGTVNAGPSSIASPGTVYRETAADRPGEGELEVPGVSGGVSTPVKLVSAIEDIGEVFGKVTVKQYGNLSVASGATVRVSREATSGGSSWNGSGALEFCPRPDEPTEVTGTFSCRELVCTSAPGTVSFVPGTKITVGAGGRMVRLRGSFDQKVVLRSATAGQRWYLTVSNEVPTDLRCLMVTDSDASGGKLLEAKNSGRKKGNNLNWNLIPSGTVIVVR